MIKSSNLHCMKEKASVKQSDKEIEDRLEESGIIKVACRILCLNKTLERVMSIASANLLKDGFTHHANIEMIHTTIPTSEPASVIGKCLKSIHTLMEKLSHKLHRGDIYKKIEDGKFHIFSMLTTVERKKVPEQKKCNL